ncbi:MAG: hypothetical protein AB7V22_04175, partial [Kiritimatiellia bacterium]
MREVLFFLQPFDLRPGPAEVVPAIELFRQLFAPEPDALQVGAIDFPVLVPEDGLARGGSGRLA